MSFQAALESVRSWHVALAGILLQLAFGSLFFGALNSGGFGGVIFAVFGILFLLAAAAALIPFVLLFFERTRMLGAVLSIILGAAGIVLKVGIVAGPFLLAAGILHLWKKI